MSRTYHHGNKAKKRLFGDNWRWMTTPGKWTREMMTPTWRQQTKQLLHRWEREGGEVIVPNGRKPHLYYW